MTIVAVSGRQMAADSWEFADHIGFPVGFPKIVRAPDGSLIGGSGGSMGCYELYKWVLAGMPEDKTPELPDDEPLTWLWLKTDGSLWMGQETFSPWPIHSPNCIGQENPGSMVLAALNAGQDLFTATEFAVARCNKVGGPIQLESLDG